MGNLEILYDDIGENGDKIVLGSQCYRM